MDISIRSLVYHCIWGCTGVKICDRRGLRGRAKTCNMVSCHLKPPEKHTEQCQQKSFCAPWCLQLSPLWAWSGRGVGVEWAGLGYGVGGAR